MKQQLSAAWARQGRARGGGVGVGGYGIEGRGVARPLGLPPPLQTQQQQPQPGSGMRAVFLAGPGARRESAGTGVFLPRRVGTPTESLKKPGNNPCIPLASVGFGYTQLFFFLFLF